VINLNSKIYVAGHNGLVGSAILRKLKKIGYRNILIANRKKLDLTKQLNVLKFLKKNKPDFIFLAAAKVGGVYSNNMYKADYLYENLAIQSNVINGAYLSGVKDLIFLGSSCIYPKKCKQPIKESYLLTGELEPTNDAYALAKITGIKMCESYNQQYKTNYKCLMPTNTFGPNDNYDELNSHFFPALIRKIDKLKNSKKNSIILWGNGKAKREVIHVDDIANACIYFMNKKKKPTLINIGTGKDYTITYYAKLIAKTILPKKKIIIKYDLSKPNGIKRKVMDVSLASMHGWRYKISLKKAILSTYRSFKTENKKI
jgi:GDP-L-fucose synthase